MALLTEEDLDALRAKHGNLAAMDTGNDEHTIVVRALRHDRDNEKKDEFSAYMTLQGRMRSTGEAGNADLEMILACVVHPDAGEVEKHLREYPGDVVELRNALESCCGYEAYQEAPELLTPQALDSIKAKRGVACKINGAPVLFRRMSQHEYSKYIEESGGKPHPLNARALLNAAWRCSSEMPKDDADAKGPKRKPQTEDLMRQYPGAMYLAGAELVQAAFSGARLRAKK